MTDDADTIALKIRKAKTDPAPLPDSEGGLAGRPEAANLLGIHAALTDTTLAASIARFAGQNFSTFKEELAAVAVPVLGRIGDEMRRLLADPGYIDGILRLGSVHANAIAAPHLSAVQDIVGLLRP
jgi:tryptophanyl-tRNA synthetase